jgi:hypothetical protein
MLKQILAVGLVMFSGVAFAQKHVDCSKMSPAEVRMVDDVTTTCKAPVDTKAEKKATQKLIAQASREARSKIASQFKDPDSVKFKNLRISKDGMTVCGEVNGKNSYGGYTGFKLFYSLWMVDHVSVVSDDTQTIYDSFCAADKTQPLK